MNIYYNYHKHDIYTNTRVRDAIVNPEDFMKRSVELSHKAFFTTNHGCSGNVFEAYDMCKEYGLICIFGMELYFVYDRLEKTKNNYHIIAIALNREGYRELNYINSEANISGFYRQPRVDMELLLSLTPQNFVITTACINNPIFFQGEEHDSINDFLLPLKNHFRNHFFLETQSHCDPQQIAWNKQILELSKKYKIGIIHANDSHYIYPEDKVYKSEFLKGKKFMYSFEDDFILDYPDYDTVMERYKEQKVLNDEEIRSALNNTLIFERAEDLGFTKDIKMPTIYPELTLYQRIEKMQDILNQSWRKYRTTIKDKEELERRKQGIHSEFQVIQDCNEEVQIADYFLLNKAIIDKAVNEYGGVLTRTGRGSAVSYAINKLLGFTEVDRFDAEVPLYPSRFISSSRLLQSRSLPDIDFNMADDKPFIQASKDILGEHSVYRMIAYGKMKDSSAFRNLCRARDLEMNEYNHVAKNLELYKDDKKWKDLIEESKKYIGVIENISPSPCSFVMLNDDIRKEIGVMRIKGELCACIDGYTSDVWKFLKNDFLLVKVWEVIYRTFELIGQPIPTIKELKEMLDDKVWNLYRDGITATLNQVDSDFATHLVKKYAPKTPAELTSFVAVIRPACESFRDDYLTRMPYSSGTPELDEILNTSQHRLIYQENLMAYFSWLGIHEDETYDLIKKISKKKLKEKELEGLKLELRKNWIRIVGNDDNFNPTWEVVESSAKYLFNASHAYSVAYDSLYGAYLKANYPYEYYTVVLNTFSDDSEKVKGIEKELPYFNITISPIKFRHSLDTYTFNKETNTIYKGISSIKYLNKRIAKELYTLRDNTYNSFADLLTDVTNKTSVNSRQLDILIKLNFFEEFGETNELLAKTEIFNTWYKKKQIKKDELETLGLTSEIVDKFCSKSTEKLYKDFDYIEIIDYLYGNINYPKTSIKDKIDYESEFLGYIQITIPTIDESYAYILNVDGKYKNKLVTLYRLKNGDNETVKVKARQFEDNPIRKGDVIKTVECSEEKKWGRDAEGNYYQKDEYEAILKKWSFVK